MADRARPLLALAALALLAAPAAPAAPAARGLLDFDPWGWLPARRAASAPIVDYFFPPSRTPKHSSLISTAASAAPSSTSAPATATPTAAPTATPTLAESTVADTTVAASSTLRTSRRAPDATSTASPAPGGGTRPTDEGGETGATEPTTGGPESPSPPSPPSPPPDSREGALTLRDRPHPPPPPSPSLPLPSVAGATSMLAKPTKYHYYPHNQHIYLLPECAIQQVCNAVYVRLNYTQPLCACPARYRDPCSASLNADDLHTTRLTTHSKKKYARSAVTLVKTCEAVSEMRECRAPRDWSLLALQNIRTGKSHYLVICRCPDTHVLEGPMSHDQPTYASVPGIRVYGMMCVRAASPTAAVATHTTGYNALRYTAVALQSTTPPRPGYYGSSHRRRRRRRSAAAAPTPHPPFPWHAVQAFAHTLAH